MPCRTCLKNRILKQALTKFIWMLPERYWSVRCGTMCSDWQTAPEEPVTAWWQGCTRPSKRYPVRVLMFLQTMFWLNQRGGMIASKGSAGCAAYLVGVRCPLNVLEEREESTPQPHAGTGAGAVYRGAWRRHL